MIRTEFIESINLMSLFSWNTRKIHLRRGDALGGALPLVVMHSDSLSEMRVGGNKHRKHRKNRKMDVGRLVIALIICGVVTAVVSALLTQGPQF